MFSWLKATCPLCFCLLLIFVAPVQAQRKPVGGLAKDEFRIQYFGKSKGRLAFTYQKGGQEDIYVLNFGDLRVTPLCTNPKLNESAPSWSPDGQTLAFQASEIGSDTIDIFTIGADGSNRRQLTQKAGMNESPDWSTNGKRIAFSSTRDGGSSIYLIDPDGKNLKPLKKRTRPQKSIELDPRYSPRGDGILYSSDVNWPGRDIIFHEFDSVNNKILTTGYQDFSLASWHPTGGSFVASHINGKDIDIWNFKKGFKYPEVIVERPGKDFDGAWSDEGEKLFFAGEATPGEDDYQLFVWDNKEQKLFQITNAKGSVRKPAWTPFPSLQEIVKELKEKK